MKTGELVHHLRVLDCEQCYLCRECKDPHKLKCFLFGDAADMLEAQQKRIKELEAALAQSDGQAMNCTEQELEAYRRAERVERVAKERAEQIYAQANGVLAEATLKAESASAHIGAIADQVSNQLKEYQDSVLETKATFQEAVATLYAIKPKTEE